MGKYREEVIGGQTMVLADCLEYLSTLAASSVDLICTDPPYFRVKNLPWDRQWEDTASFISWIGRLCEEWRRVLKPNGSLYVFASRKMASRVELEVERHFSVVNHITWAKPEFSTKAEMFRKDDLRSFFPVTEDIIFAEQFGADSSAKGEAGYGAACDELRGFVFEPLRAYLDGERRRAGIDGIACNVACGFSATPGGMAARHYFGQSQWEFPTEAHYAAMRDLFNARGRQPAPPYEEFHEAPRERFEKDLRADYSYLRADYSYLRADYSYLRADYSYLRADYEDLRRPFAVTADVPYTDVWNFPTVNAYPGKHPCEKPLAMMEHIIRTSSREGATVLDCFMGSGVTLEACRNLGREGIGVELDEHWHGVACRRVEAAAAQPRLEFEEKPKRELLPTLTLD
jgi:adenine-specific DNA-methyltransferase